jgi:hypothetical protein
MPISPASSPCSEVQLPWEWGFAGYDGGASPLLPNPAPDQAPKALTVPKNDT